MSAIANTLFTGKVLVQFTSLPSTNQYALELLSKNKPSEGTVISTVHQTAGRGQFGSQWMSEAGNNVTLSVIFYPNFLAIRQQFYLNIAIALGVHDCLNTHCHVNNLRVKWPNDIYANNKKLGGILIQNTISHRKISASVIGIGVNVNQSKFDKTLPNPGSVFLSTQQKYDIDEVIQVLCKTLEIRYLMLRRGEFEQLEQDYYKVLYRYGEMADYRRTDGTSFRGKITGITTEGYLRIESFQGKVEQFNLKEIQYIL